LPRLSFAEVVEEYEVAGVSNGIDLVDRSDAPSSPLPEPPIAWSLCDSSLLVLCVVAVAVVASGAFREEVNGRRIVVCIDGINGVSRGLLGFFITAGGLARLGPAWYIDLAPGWEPLGKVYNARTHAGGLRIMMKSSDKNDIPISYWSTGPCPRFDGKFITVDVAIDRTVHS